ncbi:hypothetical protein [Legionella bononiensis]|uniref:hypothetical protein n=1 Tax=Legionella bononiensis TaxID=2793102 RepID=UPI0019344AFA|nr:hypothetical protein [Legionella bononiensis]MBL7480590.1 hypothetical protein [Legionella bononiensis]
MQRIKCIIAVGLLAINVQALSYSQPQGQLVIQGGGFSSNTGKPQHIYINTLVGDQYTVTSKHDKKGLFGLSYLISGPNFKNVLISYGVSGFYFPKIKVNGDIIQENLFANLGYSYEISQVPIYATTKAVIMNHSDQFGLTVDAGIGPNLIKTKTVNTWPINGSNALPERVFSGRSNTAFSAMAGVGFRINHVLGKFPLDCGYRYFYLGKGSFYKRSDEWLNTLSTGDNYAQAVICSVTV